MSQQQKCATTVDSGDTWQGRALKKDKGSKEKGESKGDRKGKEEGKTSEGWWWNQKGKGKGLQSMSEYDE